MTNPERIEMLCMLAERVMGWERIPDYGTSGWSHAFSNHDGPFFFVDNCGTGISVRGQNLSSFWQPDVRIEHAWMLVDALIGHGYHMKLNTPFDPGEPFHAGFTPMGVTGWNGRPDHRASENKAPLAICLAAYEAAKRMEPSATGEEQ